MGEFPGIKGCDSSVIKQTPGVKGQLVLPVFHRSSHESGQWPSWPGPAVDLQ